MKMPAMQFYPADWRKDPAVQSLEYHDKGIWFEIMCLMHESSERGVLLLNGLPMPRTALARILGLDLTTLEISLTKLITYGVAKVREQDGAIYSKRMVSDEYLCKVRREAGKLGGNPNLLNQNSTTGVNQKPTPSSSSSSSSSDIKESKKENPFLLPDWINQSDWDMWMKTRKGKKMIPLQMMKQVHKLQVWKDSGQDYAGALEAAAINGYTGLYLPDNKASPQKPVKFNASEYLQGHGDGYGNPTKGNENGIIEINPKFLA